MIIPPLFLGEPIRNRTEVVRAGSCVRFASWARTPGAAPKASKPAENLIKLETRRNRNPSRFGAWRSMDPGNIPMLRA